MQYFKRALKLDKRCLSAWTLMGHEYLELKNPSAAIGMPSTYSWGHPDMDLLISCRDLALSEQRARTPLSSRRCAALFAAAHLPQHCVSFPASSAVPCGRLPLADAHGQAVMLALLGETQVAAHALVLPGIL